MIKLKKMKTSLLIKKLEFNNSFDQLEFDNWLLNKKGGEL
jgi:hypothetical protein